LQQTANRAFGFSPERTMEIAQILYETGLITYHRTDSVAVAPEAQSAAQALIEATYGQDYLPVQPPVHTTKTPNAQEAHEAIRPVEVTHTPEVMAGGAEGEGARLYALIWERFIASQMVGARYQATAALIRAARVPGKPYPLEFQAQGQALVFEGFLKVYREPADDAAVSEADSSLPPLGDGQPLTFLGWRVGEHTTHPPDRYTEAALIQALEQRGIGRPSTYASTLKALQGRDYVALEHKRLVPTETGKRLWDFLAPRFGLLVLAYAYTANLEVTLDQVAAGKLTRLDALRKFWADFGPALKMATELTPKKVAPTVRPVTFTRVGQGV
jgi:DNA topoisomerase-1